MLNAVLCLLGINTPQLQSWVSLLRSTPMKMERIVSSETSALKAQTPGDYPKDTIRGTSVLNCVRNSSPLVLAELLSALRDISRPVRLPGRNFNNVLVVFFRNSVYSAFMTSSSLILTKLRTVSKSDIVGK